MDADTIEQRIKELSVQYNQATATVERAKADANAIGGAIQELQRILAELETPEENDG
jgi:hypothetical protein